MDTPVFSTGLLFPDALPDVQPKPKKKKANLFVMICVVCGYDLRLMGMRERGQASIAMKKLRAKYALKYEEDPDFERKLIKMVRAFQWWWRRNDYQGKRRRSPTPSLMMRAWPDFCEFVKEHCRGRIPESEEQCQ